MKHSRLSQYLLVGATMLLGLILIASATRAQDSSPEDAIGSIPLLDGDPLARKQYLIQLSGTIMNETFSGAQALLTLTGPLNKSEYRNPYLIIIEGFPKQNSVNSFYWDSEDSEMTAFSNDITCNIKRTFVRRTSQYFYHLSPILVKPEGPLEMLAMPGDEGEKLAESVALPTYVNARAGRLNLRIHSNSLSGTVWMKGYDPVEKSFVLYSARLQGKKTYGLDPKQEQKKGTMVRE